MVSHNILLVVRSVDRTLFYIYPCQNEFVQNKNVNIVLSCIVNVRYGVVISVYYGRDKLRDHIKSSI